MEKSVLLRLVETVDFIDKEDCPSAIERFAFLGPLDCGEESLDPLGVRRVDRGYVGVELATDGLALGGGPLVPASAPVEVLEYAVGIGSERHGTS